MRIRDRKKFVGNNCYNLSNSELDKNLIIDATTCRLVIFEGLLSSVILKGMFDIGILVNASEYLALSRARQRDKTARNIDEEKWRFKKAILHDMYVPYMEQIRQNTSFSYIQRNR